MESTSVTEIVCAHSPDSDDAFMFYGLATKKVRSQMVNFRHVLEDIETFGEEVRSMPVPPYLVRYHIDDSKLLVTIVSVRHGARRPGL